MPVKRLDRAKSRLRGVLADERHAELVLALLLDTLTSATAAEQVRGVLVVCEDARVTGALEAAGLPGVDWVDERGLPGLNAALRHGAGLAARRSAVVGALQADLPTLRAEELDAAITSAAGRRAFCPDREGTGTTLLLAAPGTPLAPRFGSGSAAAHETGGAVPVGLSLPTLRCDVDTESDLVTARTIGLGRRTATLLGRHDERFTRPTDEGCAVAP